MMCSRLRPEARTPRDRFRVSKWTLSLVAILVLVPGLGPARDGQEGPAAAPQGPAGSSPELKWIDTHAHPLAGPGSRENVLSAESLDRLIAVLDRQGVEKAILMQPPSPTEATGFQEHLARAVKSRPTRFAFLGGGLQPLIQEAVTSGKTSPELESRFEKKANELLEQGAVGFGEMTALHFSFRSVHPFVEAPPDHPLFLLLADVAARNDVPIDPHIEAVTKDRPTPMRFLMMSPLDPPSVRENIRGLERLLSHNPGARIVWDHIGWDNTGDLSAKLLRGLLERHSNLYLQLKVSTLPPATFAEHDLLDSKGALRPQWLELIQSFPDRCVLGSDSFMARPDFEEGMTRTGSLLRQLSPDLARKVGSENALRIYRLK